MGRRRKLTEEEKEAIRLHAGAQMSPAEVERVLERWGDAEAREYDAARILSEAKVRAAIFRSAEQGSPAAQALAMRLIRERRTDPPKMSNAELAAHREMLRAKTVGYSLEDWASYLSGTMAEMDPNSRAFQTLAKLYDGAIKELHGLSDSTRAPDVTINVLTPEGATIAPPPPKDDAAGDPES